MSFFWPKDGSDEWLSRVDGILAIALLNEIICERNQRASAPEPVLEIGVWKGAWISVILMNVPSIQADGVDPYPNLAWCRDAMLARLADLRISNRFSLASTLTDLVPNAQYSMIHIDGEHSERAVTDDLSFAAKHLVSDGVIIVDDFRNLWFPGIASALFKFLSNTQFKLFAVSENKAYLASNATADRYYQLLQESFAGSKNLPVWTHWQEWDGDQLIYLQSPSVNGQRVLLCGMQVPSERSWIRHLATNFFPPIAIRALLKAKRLKSHT